MFFKNNKIISYRNILKLLLIYFLVQTSFGSLHKHAEKNLHFHAENLITNDHTISQEQDCAICPAILAASHFLIYRSHFYFNYKIYAFVANSHKPQLWFFQLAGLKLGRSPPSFS